jgi:hypothetical protein
MADRMLSCDTSGHTFSVICRRISGSEMVLSGFYAPLKCGLISLRTVCYWLLKNVFCMDSFSFGNVLRRYIYIFLYLNATDILRWKRFA